MKPVHFIAIFWALLISAAGAHAQTLDVGLGYSRSDSQFRNVISGQGSLLFSLNDRLSAGPMLGYSVWFYVEEYEFHIDGSGDTRINSSGGYGSGFIGGHANYLLTSSDAAFKLHCGLMMQVGLFVETAGFNPVTVFDPVLIPRLAWHLPITAEFSPEFDRALGIFLRILPGHMLSSHRHKDFNPEFGRDVWSIGGQLGIRYRVE